MKKILITIATIASLPLMASYQFGTVQELALQADRATFQLDTSNGVDLQDVCDLSKELNFTIDLNTAGGVAMFEAVKEAKVSGTSIAVNGSGVCQFDEFEAVDTINF